MSVVCEVKPASWRPDLTRGAIKAAGKRVYMVDQDGFKTERLIGSLSVDGKFVYMVDDDGYIDGTVVNATTLDICYRHVRPDSAVVGCELMQRK